MAILTVGQNGFNEAAFFDRSDLGVLGVTPVEGTPSFIEIGFSDGEAVEFTGSFDYSSTATIANNSLVAGLTWLTNGAVTFSLTGINESFAQLDVPTDNAAFFSGNDTITGGAGNDTLTGYGGNNILDGGGGTNTLDYSTARAGVTVNFSTGTAANGYGGTDDFSNFQNVLGSVHDDTFVGGPGSHSFDGNGGTNTLSYAAATAPVTIDLTTRSASNGFGSTDNFTNITQFAGGAGNDVFRLSQPISPYGYGGGSGSPPGDAWFLYSLTQAVLPAIDTFVGGSDDGGDAGVFITLVGWPTLTLAIDGGGGVNSFVGPSLGFQAAQFDLNAGTISLGLQTAQFGLTAETIWLGFGVTISATNIQVFSGEGYYIGGPGDHTLDGGGISSLDYSAAPGAVSVDLATGVAANGYGGTDQVSGFATVIGSAQNDSFAGGSAPVSFTGGAGDDAISGANVTAVFSGPRWDYAITPVGTDTITVTDLRAGSPDGTDTLTGVADLQFVDQTMVPTYAPPSGVAGTMSSEVWVTRMGALSGTVAGNVAPSVMMPTAGGFASLRDGDSGSIVALGSAIASFPPTGTVPTGAVITNSSPPPPVIVAAQS